MTRVVAIFGLLASLAVIFAAYSEMPEAARADRPTVEALADGCTLREIALDEGYGVTRTEKHVVCAKEDKGLE